MIGFLFRNRKARFSVLIMALGAGALSVQILTALAGANNSVSGSGESPSGIVMTVSAVDHGNGDVTGHAMFHDRQTNSKLSINVTEVSINGNFATVDGEVVKKTGDYAADCEGSHAIFVVQDNGEGSSAPVDRFTLPACYEPGQGVKAAKPFGSEMGNIQVRSQ